MNTLDDLVTAVLAEEATDAPRTDAFVARVLREQHGAHAGPQRGKWAVTMAVAAVTALIVSAAVASSVSSRLNGGAPTRPGPGASTSNARTTSEVPSDHSGRLSGWLALSSGPLHIEMDAVAPLSAPWKVWQVGCPESVLSALESGDVACAGMGKVPRYEVMVSPGASMAVDAKSRVRWDGPLRQLTSPDVTYIGGTPGVVSMTSGEVRYGCPDKCGDWVTRNLTVIGFPDRNRHVTILGPADRREIVGPSGHLSGDLGWLVNFIYVDP